MRGDSCPEQRPDGPIGDEPRVWFTIGQRSVSSVSEPGTGPYPFACSPCTDQYSVESADCGGAPRVLLIDGFDHRAARAEDRRGSRGTPEAMHEDRIEEQTPARWPAAFCADAGRFDQP